MNKIRFTGRQYEDLRQHLFPGDGCEAVAVALCGRSMHDGNHVLLVQELLLVPYDRCFERKPDKVSWPTDIINPLLEKAAKKGCAIVKIHCHPGYYEQFSEIDNQSDHQLFRSIHAWLTDDQPHASCIMLPDGRLFGRFFDAAMRIEPVHQISVAGSTLLNWYYGVDNVFREQLQTRNLQAFGKKTIQLLSNLTIAVIGCSGTGSIVIEQLKRLGVGKLILVDPDFVDFLNLNRIINATEADAVAKRQKTLVMQRAIQETGFNTKVTVFDNDLAHRDVVRAVAQADVLFSCVDGMEGRHMLNLIGSMYNLPLIDMGVKLEAEKGGGIRNIFGTVHFVQPGGSSLLNRGQYNVNALRSEAIRRVNQEEAQRNQYLAAVQEDHPAVISINMQVAAVAVNELLARIHPYRNVSNDQVDMIRIMFGDIVQYHESFPAPCEFFAAYVGKGDVEPLLNDPQLSDDQKTIPLAAKVAQAG